MLERIAARLTLNAVIIALIVGALVIQTVRIEGLRIWPISITGLKAKNEALSEKLRTISDKRDEQKKETARRIAEAENNVRVVEKVVTRLENRPISGEKCETPDLDEWRGVL